MEKHAQRMEHHGEDFLVATKDDPELREKAQKLLDQQRDIRKEIDEIRIDQLAEEKAKKKIIEV
jgi:predicted ribosome quality control (RQC) complex YloA/Tae2 family protein